MNQRLCHIVFSFVACCAFASLGGAAVIIAPNEKTKFHAPGEEEFSGTAQELYDTGQAAEKNGNWKRAIKAYRAILRRHPHSTVAADSAYHLGQCFEQTHDYLRAAGAYANVAEKYPTSPHFNESIEAMFRIGEAYLNGGTMKFLGLKINNTLDHSVEVFAYVVRLAPFGKYTARAQFDIGLAREKQGNNDLAVAAFQSVIDKYPDEPVAADAQYQIGYLWFNAARGGAKDPNAVELSKTAFQDFLFRYPKSEKAPQARENLRLLEHKQTSDSFGIAKFYDKQKNYRAAVIYYNDVIRQQPGSAEGDRAKKRISELRAKVGEAALQPRALTDATAKKKIIGTAQSTQAHRSDLPAMRASPDEVAPLPPPEADISLPPPASLEPDTTLAPSTTPTPTATPEVPEASSSPPPETTATPEATASPGS